MRTASKRLLLAVAVALSLPASAQYITPIAQSARSGALGGSLFYNASACGVAVDYRHGFMLAALADKSVRLQLPVGAHGTALAAWNHRGDAAWHEQQALVGYGMQVAPWLHAAVGARWMLRGTDDAHYERRQWLAPSALLQASWQTTTLTLLAGSRPWDDRRPWRMHLQAAYRPQPQWLAVAEWECEERSRLRMGLEYTYGDNWFLRAGMATRPTVFTFGLGTRWRHLAVDLAVEVHDVLGLTPQTSLALWF